MLFKRPTERGIVCWDRHFMNIAELTASDRSKDPNTQVGACIVNPDNRIVGVGYNGFPNGCSDDEFPWERTSESGSPLDTKYLYVVHAELNAILNSTTNLVGCTIYVTMLPCNECAKAIIQSGIRRVIFTDDKYKDTDSCIASMRMLQASGVNLMKLRSDDSLLRV